MGMAEAFMFSFSVLENYLRVKCVHSSCRQEIPVWCRGGWTAAPETRGWLEPGRAAALTSLKWTSCMPTSSIMEASSSMFGVITLKAVHPCLNMPRIERAGETVGAINLKVDEPRGFFPPCLFLGWTRTDLEISCVSGQHSHGKPGRHCVLSFIRLLIFN